MDIRFLDLGHLTAYRDLRFAGLKESPSAFGSSYEEEAALPMLEFAARLRPPNRPDNGIFGAFVDGGRLVGVLGFARESREKRPHVALVWGMYVSPEFRGQGIGAALLNESIAYARKLGTIRQIVLAVTASNVAAASLYRSRGFERFGLERDALLVDGAYYDEEHMVLFLKETS